MNQNSTNRPSKACGCPDFEMSRRGFLGGVAAATGVMTAGSLFGDAFQQVSYGAAPGGNVLVVLSFRGGSDGLSIVVPKNATDQGVINTSIDKGGRANIAIPVNRLVAGNANWGLHPAMQPLEAMWNAGTFGAVQAVGLPESNMSHFDAMEELELARPGSTERQGWINRLVGLDGGALPEEQIQIGDQMLPTALVGNAPALGTYQVTDLKMPDLWNDTTSRLNQSLTTMWGGNATTLNQGVRTAIGSVQRLSSVADDAAAATLEAEKALYPDGDLRDVLANTAMLIKADVGAKMITIDYGNWDMHAGLGNEDPQPGQWMYDQLDHFARSMKAFFDDLGAAADRTTLVTISEFGRRVYSNGDRGLDHGYAGLVMAFGAGVNGGDVRGSAGLNLDALDRDGNIALQHDYRSVLWDVVSNRFPGPSRGDVFPGAWDYQTTDIMA
ncbi:MAG: DUF1501 domain-containing protein [Nocardioidaceae bacterium]|nr:DUF1501 domain-containing protein [Nocardioidaceae bacterium]